MRHHSRGPSGVAESRTVRIVMLVGLVMAMLVLVAAPSDARPAPHVAMVQDLSTATPDGTADCGSSEDTIEREATIAASPVDRHRVVAAWQLLPAHTVVDAASRAAGPIPLDDRIVVASSDDGGATWHRADVPNVSCSSGAPRGTFASDPAITFSADGSTVYLTVTTNAMPLPDGTVISSGNSTVVVVSTSSDGGRSWSAVPALVGPGDRSSITSDPVDPNNAYVAFGTPYEGPGTSIAVARTTDAGTSWSAPNIAYASASDQADAPAITAYRSPKSAATELFVAFGGGMDTKTCCWWVLGVHSDDGGSTWTGASGTCPPSVDPTCSGTIAEWAPAMPHDPDTGTGMSGLPAVSAAVDHGGRLWVSWVDADPASSTADMWGSDSCALGLTTCGERRSEVRIATSGDDGASWTAPLAINPVASRSSQAFQPHLAVNDAGVVAVAYYDFRRDRAGDAVLTTNAWLTRTLDGGRTWDETDLLGRFDLRSAFADFSDYLCVAAAGDDFEVAVVAALPATTRDGPVDTYRVLVSG
jgi:Neuraminidase (sialidase)